MLDARSESFPVMELSQIWSLHESSSSTTLNF
jgi:hypothetical protein